MKAVFFDLDGTLLDTAADLHSAMNLTLQKFNTPLVNFCDFRLYIHHGTKSMIRFSFNIDENHCDFAKIRQDFLENYAANIAVKTKTFEGIETVLNFCETQKLPWGIITNKPNWLTQLLLKKLGFISRCCCVVAGDTLPYRKPHPAPLLYACQSILIDPHTAVYVGDTEDDIKAAKNAGLRSIAVTYGYHPPHSDPEQWNADYIAKDPLHILECLKKFQ